jgi:hypothetical protein
MQQHKQLDLSQIRQQFKAIFGTEMHLKRQHSLADAAMGLMNSDSLRLHALGEGLARAKGNNKKHTTKQIDRLLSNPKLEIWDIAAYWVPYIIGQRKEIEVALDWTSFWHDDQHSLCLNLLTTHGRATPLMWRTVDKKRLKHNRGHYEDEMLSRLKEVLPNDVIVTLVADRGFAAQKFFDFIGNELGFNYVIRLKSSTTVISNKDTVKKAREWMHPKGHARNIKNARLTNDEFPVEQVIVTREKNMKDAWYLVSNCKDKKTREIINLYGRRWKIEPYFRDIKDQRFGFGLSQTHIKSPQRRDRLFLIVAITYVLLTLLGAAGEQLGFDKKLKVNTVKTRTHSLIRQGMFYYDFFQHFTEEERDVLMEFFNTLLEQHGVWTDILCAI